MHAAGILLATGALMNDASAPILHLRNVNAYVSAALEDWRKNARLEARVPLQPGSGLLSFSCEPRSANALAGTSSFGLSGVNAHAIFAAPESASPTSQLQPSFYTRQRFWCIPSARLLLSGAQTHGSGMLMFSCDLRSQALSYLWDHQVCPVLGCTVYCCQCMLMVQFIRGKNRKKWLSVCVLSSATFHCRYNVLELLMITVEVKQHFSK